MVTDREIALEQALVAVIGAARFDGDDEGALVDRASPLLLGNHMLRRVEHPHVDAAIAEIRKAHAEVVKIASINKG